MTLKCQACGQAFVDFDGCFALRCSRCLAGLCAWCGKSCANQTVAHDHVRPPALTELMVGSCGFTHFPGIDSFTSSYIHTIYPIHCYTVSGLTPWCCRPPEKMFDKARQVGHAAVSKASIEGDCGGLRRRSGACSSLAALGNGLKLQRSSAAKARSCSDARQGKLSQGRPRPMSHSLQRRATASVEAFKAPKRAMQQFRKPM